MKRIGTLILTVWYPAVLAGLGIVIVGGLADGSLSTSQPKFWLALFLVLYHSVLYTEAINTFRRDKKYVFRALVSDAVDIIVMILTPLWLGILLNGAHETLVSFFWLLAVAFLSVIVLRKEHTGWNLLLDGLCGLGIAVAGAAAEGFSSPGLAALLLWLLFIIYLVYVVFRATRQPRFRVTESGGMAELAKLPEFNLDLPEFHLESRFEPAMPGFPHAAAPSEPEAGVGAAAPAPGPPPPFVTIDVFYATNRARSGSAKPAEFYSDGRCAGATAELGHCTVTVPTDRRMGKLTAPSVWRLEFREDPKKHVILVNVSPLDSTAFFTAVRDHVSRSEEQAAFVFIHGFKTSFEDAVRRTGQLAYDLHFAGAPICFSWPSKGGFLDYSADEATIGWTTQYLSQFLLDLCARSGVERLHLLAHSMGNRALTEALDAIATGQPAKVRFQEVILAAPDIDAGVFRQLAASIRSTARRVTLYASSNDAAIKASKEVHEAPRAGESGDGILVVPGVDTIDVSAVKTDLIGHSYYGSNRSVLSDIFNLIRNGLPPERRPGLVQRMLRGPLQYWSFVP